MSKTFRVAMAGVAHTHYRGLLHTLQSYPNVKVVAVSDHEEGRLKQAQSEFGIPSAYRDYHELLEKEELDIILCCSENVYHAEITEAASEKGVHLMVEKPMASSFDHARRMLEAAHKAGTRLMINWPSAWSPMMQKIYALVREGTIGEIFHIRVRVGHGGPHRDRPKEERATFWWYKKGTGGGALLDFCCYGANLSRWLIGQPARAVTGMADRLVLDFGEVEDNAVLVVRYEKAICVLEGTWSQVASGETGGPSIHGSEGAITSVDHEGQQAVKVVTPSKPAGEIIVPDPLPVGMRSGPEHFLTCIGEGKPFLESVTPELNLDVQAILEAGALSVAMNRTVSLPL
jgi:predicted dehydrogenase